MTGATLTISSSSVEALSRWTEPSAQEFTRVEQCDMVLCVYQEEEEDEDDDDDVASVVTATSP